MFLHGVLFVGSPLVAFRADGAIELTPAAGVVPVALETELLTPGVFSGYLRAFSESYAFLGTAPPNRYQFSVDAGLSWLWWNGSAWVASAGTYAQANPAIALTDLVLAQLENPAGTLVVRTWMAGNPPAFPVFNGLQALFDACLPCPSVRPGRGVRSPEQVDLATEAEAGTEKRRQKRADYRRTFELQWEALDEDERACLGAWWDAHRLHTPWDWEDPITRTVISVRFADGLLIDSSRRESVDFHAARAALVQVL